MLHGYDMAVPQNSIERALCAVKQRIPLNLGQILQTSRNGAGRIFWRPVPSWQSHPWCSHPGRPRRKTGTGVLPNTKGIFSEGLVVPGPDIAVHLLPPRQRVRRKDLHAAIQGKTVEGWTFQKSHTAGAAGGSQDAIQPQKFQPLIPAIQHQNIHHTPAAVRAGILPCSANADGRFSPAVPLTIG